MTLGSGTKLGPYEIVAPLGAGGMGEVYRARDTRLERDVAIKVLPEHLSRDKERVLRFEREAKVLASLNHPNIAAIYGFETTASGGTALRAADAGLDSQSTAQRAVAHTPVAHPIHFLVLEFVEGETLAQRLNRGALPVEEALEVCKQITESLEAAHEKGVVHRDLKPGNVMVKADGTVKVLDFGLARAMHDDPSTGAAADSPTITANYTRPGVVLGTAAYMSPEQARGRPLDKRTDIWSFGCVLYESLAGRRPFEGETTSDLIAQILERDPGFDALPHNTPMTIRGLIHRCLEKDRKRRLRDIGDAVLDLDEAISTRAWSTTAMAAATASSVDKTRRLRALIPAAALLVAGAILGIALWNVAMPVSPTPISRVSIAFPSDMKVGDIALSPNGQTLAWYARPKTAEGQADAEGQIYTRRLDSYDIMPVRGTAGAWGSYFSPDSRWIGFVAPVSPGASKAKLAKVPVDGSAPPMALADWRDEWSSWQFLPGNDILILEGISGKTFLRLPAEGGSLTPARTIDTGEFKGSIGSTLSLPTGDAVLLRTVLWATSGYQLGVGLLDLETGVARMLLETGDNPSYSPTGHLLFSRGETLLAAPFDAGRLELTGGPVAICGGLRTLTSWHNGWFAVSENGTLVYTGGGRVGAKRRIVTVDPGGKVEPWSTERRPFESNLRVSPDGRKLAVTVSDATGKYEIWVSEIDRPRLRQLAVAPDADCDIPVWSPEGQQLAYSRYGRNENDGVYVRRADGSGEPERLAKPESEGKSLFPLSWSPDGTQLLIAEGSEGKNKVFLLPLKPQEHGERAASPLLGTPSVEDSARFSPDGKWITYTSDDSGRNEVYICRFNEDGTTGAAIPISSEGGYLARWAADGKTVFYTTEPQRIMAASISTEPELSVSQPQQVLDLELLRWIGYGDVLPDGRFIFIQKGDDEGDIEHVNVVLNWFEELKGKVPAGNNN